jgi:hypothetical protein
MAHATHFLCVCAFCRLSSPLFSRSYDDDCSDDDNDDGGRSQNNMSSHAIYCYRYRGMILEREKNLRQQGVSKNRSSVWESGT